MPLCSASLEGVENPQQKEAMTARRDKLGEVLTAEQLKKADPIIQDGRPKRRNSRESHEGIANCSAGCRNGQPATSIEFED